MTPTSSNSPEGIELRAPIPLSRTARDVLSTEAVTFLARLQREFGSARTDLLAARSERQARISAGEELAPLQETAHLRNSSWSVAHPPAALLDRRVEITGPTDAKMMINALNSGANIHMADFEDANTPTFSNMVDGQANLRLAVDRRLEYESPDGRHYSIVDDPAVLVVRPRGWHLPEKHLLIDGSPMSAALFDLGLYMFHCARGTLEQGFGPYFYLPKLQGHREARLWNDVFCATQDWLALPRGTIRATVLIETIFAAFEMDEILYELRDHIAGLNAGRWDYIFSIIKAFHDRGTAYLLPDRSAVTMTAPFMRAYTELLVRTCHRRGAHAIGGMAAFIPSRSDPGANAVALAEVAKDKEREAADGFDGSWVAHPGLVDTCRMAFDAVLDARPNQLVRRADEPPQIDAGALTDVSSTPGHITEGGLRNNVSVAVQYLASWMEGQGAVAINSLMEDAATAEISRSQVWQWVHNGANLPSGQAITADLVRRVLKEEVGALNAARYGAAQQLFEDLALRSDFVEFLTLPAYDLLP